MYKIFHVQLNKNSSGEYWTEDKSQRFTYRCQITVWIDNHSSLVIRNIQIEDTNNFSFSTVRWIYFKSDSTQHYRRFGVIRLKHCCGNVNWQNYFGEQFDNILPTWSCVYSITQQFNFKKTEQNFDMAHREMHKVFIATLSIKEKKTHAKYSSVGKGLNKLWFGKKMESYRIKTRKMNGLKTNWYQKQNVC